MTRGIERTKPSTTAIIVVDIQEKLAPAMPPERLAAMQRAATILLGAAGELRAPVIATEQYPKGLGPTIPAIAEQLQSLDATPVHKLAFSACNEPAFLQALKECGADAAIVIGMETHICVFQTVRALVSRGLRVDLAVDGVASRRDDHRQVGIDLCARAGATITTAETILFDWLMQSGTDTFKKLSRLVR